MGTSRSSIPGPGAVFTRARMILPFGRWETGENTTARGRREAEEGRTLPAEDDERAAPEHGVIAGRQGRRAPTHRRKRRQAGEASAAEAECILGHHDWRRRGAQVAREFVEIVL